MRSRRVSRLGAIAVAAFLAAGLLPGMATGQQRSAGKGRPLEVVTRSDRAETKLHPVLRERLREGSTATTPVFVTAVGDTSTVESLLRNSHIAKAPRGAALIVGSIPTQQLTKLASARGVVSVGPIQLRQTGRPFGDDPQVSRRPDPAAVLERINSLRAAPNDVPWSEAPPLKGSNFQALKRLGVLDAKTHHFAKAWRRGFAGQGTNVAVLDSGTDFGHPDLLGTWQRRANGWPRAFDPYGTLLWLVAPDYIDLGLSFYTRTQLRDVSGQTPDPGAPYSIRFRTRKGPARNFSAPDETVAHTYRFPQGWTQSGRVRIGFHPDEWLLSAYKERPAVLVVDPNQAGRYDTVYVDLDNDYRFGDEKPVTRRSPASYRDMNGDGYTDLSGGLLYHISNGEGPNGNTIPGGPEQFGLEIKGAPGELLAWSGDYDPAIGGHGTLTASNVAGQGVINGAAPRFSDLPGDGRYPGAVIGGAPKTKLVPFSDIYFSFDFSTQFAYLLTNDAGVDVTTNSYGSSEVDNDGYDAASQEADIWHTAFGAKTTPFFSTGNGGPGFGTVAPPSPYTGIAVGASTQFGGTGWDSIKRISQVVDDDVTTFSNRGPGATGAVGVDVVANGAYSSGDIPLNLVGDGNYAWETWGGTSRSAPVAGAAGALVYQAQEQARGGIPEGFAFDVKEVLKSSAQDLGYDSYVQGAGSVEAARAVRIATRGGAVSPSEWRPGDYRGEEYPVFTHYLRPGESDSQRFSISGGADYKVSDRQLRRTDYETVRFTSSQVGQESEYNFNAPDYLIDVSDMVKEHAGADLMTVRAVYQHEQLDPNGDYSADQTWRMLTYNWTDINNDGNLWTDDDGDGAVDHVSKDTSSNIDGFPDIDFQASEMDKGEYVRFMYNNADHNTLQTAVRDADKRMDDGIFVGFQHDLRSDDIPRTNFRLHFEFWENTDWGWVSTPGTASGAFDATIDVPRGAPYGMYSGAIVLKERNKKSVVPISVTVAAKTRQNADGELTGSIRFGGEDVARDQADLQYDNGRMFGANDWGWRPESGDWRFFYYDVPRRPAEGSLFLANTKWQDEAPHTDIDTLIFGRSENAYQLLDGSDPIGAPYILDTVGGSRNTNVGAGVWTFDTATGGPEEWVTAPVQRGLHAVVHHEVDWEGNRFYAPFETELGSATVNPNRVEVTTGDDSGEFDVTFRSTLDLPGLSAEGFGLSQPTTTTETARQDDPDDPSTSSVKVPVTLDHAARATFSANLANNDIDLYVVYDANNDGDFTLGEIVGASATATGDESVELVNPPDGNYQVWVHGWAVAGSPTFPLTIFPVQGNDLQVTGVPSGPVDAGTPVTLSVRFQREMDPGEDYFGELQLGPPAAPGALSVPITVHRQ